MYYEEKLINGILMFRSTPDGDWRQCSIEMMSQRIVDAGLRQSSIVFENLPKIRGGLRDFEEAMKPSVEVLVKVKDMPYKSLGRYLHGLEEWQVQQCTGEINVIEWWYLPKNESGNKVD